ncbi:MAG: hypothetical protein WCY82_01725 [Desulfotomaculaceae bacterium]
MIFLTDDDFRGIIPRQVWLQLAGDGRPATEAETLAISELSPLRNKCNLDTELSKSGALRNQELVRMMINLASYYLYNTVVDSEIPERITNNFNKEIRGIQAIASGKQYTTLERVNDSVTGTPKTNFRYGGDTPRTHDPFYM